MSNRRTDEHGSRRAFLRNVGAGLGATVLGRHARAIGAGDRRPHHHPRAKRVIFLFMAGGPSQMDLLDPKPELARRTGAPMPDSLVAGERVAQLRGRKLIIVGSRYRFAPHGQCGTEVSELLPHTGSIVDKIAVVRSLHTEAINHDPGMTMMQTGFQQPGRPCMGAWVTHGLGPLNPDLPPFVVMISGAASGAQPLYSRLWSAGFLPGHLQGVQLRSGEEPVLFLSNPQGVDRTARRRLLDTVRRLNEIEHAHTNDPAVATRMRAYELAYRMQASMPEVTDLGSEPDHVLDLYGARPGAPSFATNCLLARRMVERGVRFVQLYHRGWDHHENLPPRLEQKCAETDRAAAALVVDLERRGLLDDTLVIWGGEFGRSPMNQGSMLDGNYGRDHHAKSFSMWLAGGGIKPGIVWGATDDLGYDVVEGGMHINDLHATILHCLGLQHRQLTHFHEGRDFRLTDVGGKVIHGLLA